MRHNHVDTQIQESCRFSSKLPQPLNTENESRCDPIREDADEVGKRWKLHDDSSRFMRGPSAVLDGERARFKTPQHPVNDS